MLIELTVVNPVFTSGAPPSRPCIRDFGTQGLALQHKQQHDLSYKHTRTLLKARRP